MNNLVMIIDGNSLMNRAFYGIPPLTTKDGIHTNAVLGFLNMMNKLIDEYEPTHMSVAFDMRGPTFRHKQFEAYKGTRTGMQDELRMQMPIVKEVLDALGIHRMEIQGYEADDLIGTVAKHFGSKKINVKVVTGDKDALQLTDEHIQILYAKKGQFLPYTEEMILEEFGVEPIKVIDFKGLAGDSSDNIPGIPGFGPKTATKLLVQFGSVEGVIMHADEVTNKRWQNLIKEHEQQALLSKKLATIMTNVPLDFEDDSLLMTGGDIEAIIDVLTRYEFTRLLSRYKTQSFETSHDDRIEETIEPIIVDSDEGCRDLRAIIKSVKNFTFSLINDKENILTDDIIGMGLYVKNKYYYIIANEETVLSFKGIFEDENIKKSGHELKQEYLKLFRYGIHPEGFEFDTFIAAYLISPSIKTYDVSELLIKENTQSILSSEEFLGKGKKAKLFADIPVEEVAEFACKQCFGIKTLKDIYETTLEDHNLTSLYYDVELPLVEVLADLEFQGMAVDENALDEMDTVLTKKVEDLKMVIYDLAGEEFNINSPKQLGVILFEKLELPVGKKTKTGYSTSHDILMKLRLEHVIIEKIIEYRTYAKLKSTYIDGLKAVINPVSGRIHSSFNQTVAVTGRLSSTDPNMQNIPMKLEEGRLIRKIFVARDNYNFVDADYSQIELRVLAHMSKDETLIYAFTHDIDIHTLTAASVFHVEIDEVTRLQRSRAKEVNFGIVYGMSDFGLSENLKISRKEAKEYITNYFNHYGSVKAYMDEQVKKCKETGYVTTMFNRKRIIPEINSSNFNLRSFGERTAMNTPIQGSAADIIKIAMIKVYQSLKKGNFKSKLILQVHDELLIEAHEDELDEIKVLLKDTMENAIEMLVPLNVDMNVGKNWYETK
ncbi:MAG: DNA polymerase I [Clostridiales bacterium]|nr:DNA polymerase I [Clostridiales bacterium]